MVETSEQENQLEEVKEEELYKFSCKKCRHVLFTSENLEEHCSQVKRINANRNKQVSFILAITN